MLGITHATLGAILYANVVPTSPALYVGASALGALLPDLDVANSTISKLILPVPVFLRRIVMGTIAIGLIWAIYSSKLDTATYIGAGAYFALAVLGPHRGFTHSLPGAVLAGYLVYTWQPALVAPVMFGYVSHLLADVITGGISPLWPMPVHLRFLDLPSFGWAEAVISTAIGGYFLFSLL